MQKIETIQINQNKLLMNSKGFTYKYFKDNDTIIVESETGTGKTWTVCEHTNKLLNENKDAFMISLTSKRLLADQHVINMQQIKNKETVDYRSGNFQKGKNFICCINSLPKFFSGLNLENFDFKNCILYIDEISSFCFDLTHNETLYDVKAVYEIVKKLINKCFKLIVTQSEITFNVFTLLTNRDIKNAIMIRNKFQPNHNKVAKFYFNNKEIYNKMIEDIKQNKTFLVSCDEKK